MSLASDADQDRTADLKQDIEPVAPWRVVSAIAVGETDIAVRFVDGLEGIVHMRDLIWSDRAGVFATLRDPGVFRQVRLELGAVTWPGEIDLAPDAMHDEIERRGRWTPG
ncbi:DUF2442 domain-containing protein [Aquibium sp. ELW1220]|jgi:hypothetical protein|uniref:DUF2442 domain-containing protein n=1 Tax=Aquibium sp. ELW1220 TaxID=2976766 RepID=UPI0025B0671C|nr:DUF2442 domain-containing protein [Aquibium sp. ELW1220]MDN2584271.1 DUF2442 domain-containing protein [Aquibium sp. ELW1220]